jgi:DNA-binding MarR family transcriptional regulator
VGTRDRSDLDEARELSRRLFQVVERAQRDFGAIAAELDLTPQQARTLLFLEEPAPMSAVATHLQCDASNVTGLADRLERAGAIERVPGPDRRVKLLSLTDSGRQLRARLARRVAARSTVTAKLDRRQRAQLAALLDTLLSD